ncbi:MAG: hypothetical protein COA79_00415 [Planctomycetota bacterium]|nr:MAG: hypothetical protein COA79_00415 [Planctomycetota bacterium]
MHQPVRFLVIFIFVVFYIWPLSANEKKNIIKTLQTNGLDFVEKEYRISSSIHQGNAKNQVWIEAENSYLLSFYTNGDFKTLDNKTKVIYDIMSASYQCALNIDKVKMYDVYARIFLNKPGSYSLNSFVDGDILNATTSNIEINAKNTGRWAWIKINKLESNYQYKKITISSKGKGVFLDKLLLIPSNKINKSQLTKIGVGESPQIKDADYGVWLSEKFRPAGVKKWNSVRIKARNEEPRLFRVYFKTRLMKWTLLNKSRTLDLDADYKNGDFIQFKIKFSKKNGKSTSFENLEVSYEVNPYVIKKINNKTAELGISFINGKIYILKNMVTGKSYIPQDRGIMPFLLYRKLDNGNLVAYDQNDFYPYKPSVINLKNGSKSIKITYKGERSGIKVDVKFTVNPLNEFIDAELQIKSKGKNIAEIDFPRLSHISTSNNWENDTLIYPLNGGLKIQAPAAGGFLKNSYPKELSMPWMDIYGDKGGLFIFQPNSASQEFRFKSFHNIAMDSVELAINRNVEGTSRIKLNSVIALHKGHWHDGARIYKEWLENNKKNKENLISLHSYTFLNSSLKTTDGTSNYKNDYYSFLGSSYSVSLQSKFSNKLININSKSMIDINYSNSLADLNSNDKSLLVINNFGDNPEIFQYCNPEKKLMEIFNRDQILSSLDEYYKRQWVYNRVFPVSGSLGRKVLHLKNKIGEFISSSKKVIFLDDLALEDYQSDSLLIKRYDFNDGHKKLICLLYSSDSSAEKSVSLTLGNSIRINNVYHVTIDSQVTTIGHQYIDSALKFKIPYSKHKFGAILLSMGGNGKKMVFGSLEFIKNSFVGNNLILNVVNTSTSIARLKIDQLNLDLKKEIVSGPVSIDLKAGEARTVTYKIKDYDLLKNRVMVSFAMSNLSSGQNKTFKALIYPNVINGDFGLSSGKSLKHWEASSRGYDNYMGNNAKGSFRFLRGSDYLTTALYLKPGKKYELQYFFNIADAQKSLIFNLVFMTGAGSDKLMKKIILNGKKIDDVDFWEEDKLVFEVPVDMQNTFLKITSTGKIGKLWIDDISIKETK